MLNIIPFDQSAIDLLYPIEVACHSHPWSKNLFASCIGGRYLTFMALDRHVPIGFYILDQVLDECTLTDICIAPQYQGQGMGQVLMQHAINVMKEKAIVSCFLEVRASNVAAQKLYLGCGFKQSGIRRAYYPTETGSEDAVLMQLDFSS